MKGEKKSIPKLKMKTVGRMKNIKQNYISFLKIYFTLIPLLLQL